MRRRMPQRDAGRKWVVAELAEPCLWVEPLQIDFGRVHMGGLRRAKQIFVQNLGEREVDVAVSAEGASCLKIVPARRDGLGPGDLAVFNVELDTSQLQLDEAVSTWGCTIVVSADLTEGPPGKKESRRHEVKAHCRLVRLPKLLIRDEKGREVGEDGLPLTVSPSLEPVTVRWQLSRSDGAPLDLDRWDISRELRRASSAEKPTDFTNCLEVALHEVPGDPTVKEVVLTIHTHNLPEGRPEGSIGFWIGADDPPVEPRAVKLAIDVKPWQVVLQWPESAHEALQGREPLLIPSSVGGWLPVTISNRTQYPLEVELEALTNWLSFAPARIELAPGGESQVRAQLHPELGHPEGNALLSYVVKMRPVGRETSEERDLAQWGEAILVRPLAKDQRPFDVHLSPKSTSKGREATLTLENRTHVNLTLRPRGFRIKGTDNRYINLEAATNNGMTPRVWHGQAEWDNPQVGEEIQLVVEDAVTGRSIVLWAGPVSLPKPTVLAPKRMPTALRILPALGVVLLVFALVRGHFFGARGGSEERPDPQHVSAAMLRDAVNYIENASRMTNPQQRHELLQKALSLLDGVLSMAPSDELAHYQRARALSLSITYRPHPYEAELKQELQWLAAKAKSKNFRVEAQARAREWGFR